MLTERLLGGVSSDPSKATSRFHLICQVTSLLGACFPSLLNGRLSIQALFLTCKSLSAATFHCAALTRSLCLFEPLFPTYHMQMGTPSLPWSNCYGWLYAGQPSWFCSNLTCTVEGPRKLHNSKAKSSIAATVVWL